MKTATILRRYGAISQVVQVLRLLKYSPRMGDNGRPTGEWESSHAKPRKVSLEVRPTYPHRVIVRAV